MATTAVNNWNRCEENETERDREERKRRERERTKIGGDLYRTDYSTLNRVFGWNIGIRGRKPTQSDTQGEEGDTCVGREGFRFSPRFVARYLFSSLSLPPSSIHLHLPNALGAQRDAYISSISTGKNRFETFLFTLLTLYIHDRAAVPVSRLSSR